MKFIGFLFLSLIVFQATSQEKTDSVLPLPKIQDTTHSVKKASILSVVLPGAGQVYNHIAMPKGKKNAYWKVPLIYAGLGATGYLMIQNNIQQKSLKKEYLFREKSKFTEISDPRWQQYDAQGVLTLYEQKLNRRDLFILAFSAVYILQIVDAAVEAHFVNFDISEDLSLRVSPTVMGFQSAGLKLSFNFK